MSRPSRRAFATQAIGVCRARLRAGGSVFKFAVEPLITEGPSMIGYVTLGTNDLRRAQAFYDTLLSEMGV